MSYKLGKHHARNVEQRKKETRPAPTVESGIITFQSGTKYRVGKHGNWVKV